MDDPIGRITLGDTVIEQKDEAEMISGLNREIAKANPDLILTDRGDSFELPYLHHRASCMRLTSRLAGRRMSYLRAMEGHISVTAESSTNPKDTCWQGVYTLINQSFF